MYHSDDNPFCLTIEPSKGPSCLSLTLFHSLPYFWVASYWKSSTLQFETVRIARCPNGVIYSHLGHSNGPRRINYSCLQIHQPKCFSCCCPHPALDVLHCLLVMHAHWPLCMYNVLSLTTYSGTSSSNSVKLQMQCECSTVHSLFAAFGRQNNTV
jgi:hypothetical protein